MLRSSRNNRNGKNNNASNKRTLVVEKLEDRALMAVTISISDGSAVEGDNSIRFVDEFVSAGSAGLASNPYGMTLGPDGHLYVSSTFGDCVYRFNANTGAPLPALGKPGAEFVSSGSGGLDQPRMIAFGPGNDLYVVSDLTNSVLRYDGITGDFEVRLEAGSRGFIT